MHCGHFSGRFPVFQSIFRKVSGFLREKHVKLACLADIMRIEFTRHARDALDERRISEQDAVDAVLFPDDLGKRYGQYFARKSLDRGTICVAYELEGNFIKIITLWWL